jgi:hypothetical protein
MGYSYNLVVQETSPKNVVPGNTFWLKASQGIMQQFFFENTFTQFATGKSNLSISDGTYFRIVTESATMPSSPQIGDIWLQGGTTYWVYLGIWTQFAG